MALSRTQQQKLRHYWWPKECEQGPEGKKCRQAITQCTRISGGQSQFQQALGPAMSTVLAGAGTAIVPGIGTAAGGILGDVATGFIPGIGPPGEPQGCEKYRSFPGGSTGSAGADSFLKRALVIGGIGAAVIGAGFFVFKVIL